MPDARRPHSPLRTRCNSRGPWRLCVVAAALLAVTTVGVSLSWAQTARAPAGHPPQPPTFRSGVEAIEVFVLVKDKQGRSVDDLTREDFEIQEDGKTQVVATFSRLDLPRPVVSPLMPTPPTPTTASATTTTTTADTTPARLAPRDVATNAAADQGRLYVIVLDDLHVAANRSETVRRTLREFMRGYFHAGDKAAVVHTGGDLAATQELTDDRARLLAASERFAGKKLPQPPTGCPDPLNMPRAYNARITMNVVKQLVEGLGHPPGRKLSVILVSEGIDYNIHDVTGVRQTEGTDVRRWMQEAIAAANRNNVALYVLDPRGVALGSFSPGTDPGGASLASDQAGTRPVMSVGYLGEDRGTSMDEPAATVPCTPDQTDARPQQRRARGTSLLTEIGGSERLRLSHESMKALAEQTGGFAWIDHNDVGPGLDRIVQENSEYYVLAYHSTNSTADGRFRRIQVKVRRPDVTVVARKGYVATTRAARGARMANAANGNANASTTGSTTAAGNSGERNGNEATADAEAEVVRLLSQPLPATGLTLRAQAVPIANGSGGGSRLAARVDNRIVDSGSGGKASSGSGSSGTASSGTAGSGTASSGTAGSGTGNSGPGNSGTGSDGNTSDRNRRSGNTSSGNGSASGTGDGSASSLLVLAEVEGRGLSFTERDGHFVDRVDLVLQSVDGRGTPGRVASQSLDMALTKSEHARIVLTTLRTFWHLDLRPGRHHLRLAALERATGRAGSVFLDIDVPDATPETPTLGGLLLTSQAAAFALTPRVDDIVKALLTPTPTAVRTFVQGDTLSGLVSIFGRVVGPTFAARTILKTPANADGPPVFTLERPLVVAPDGSTQHRFDLPLAGIAVGAYTLQVALTRDGQVVGTRETTIDVLPAPTFTSATSTPGTSTASAGSAASVASVAPVASVASATSAPSATPAASGTSAAPAGSPASAASAPSATRAASATSTAPAGSPASAASARAEAIARGAALGVPLPVAFGPTSAIVRHREIVVRSDIEWKGTWALLPTRQTRPDIDFRRFMVVGVFVGDRGATAVDVLILGTRRDGDALIVQYAERPSPTATSSAEPHRPFAIAGVPTFAGPVRFERIDE